MKRFGVLLVFALVLGLAMPAVGAEFKVNGDFNNRFTTYTDQAGVFSGAGEQSTSDARRIKDDGQSDHWASFKYRMWTTAATNATPTPAIAGQCVCPLSTRGPSAPANTAPASGASRITIPQSFKVVSASGDKSHQFSVVSCQLPVVSC